MPFIHIKMYISHLMDEGNELINIENKLALTSIEEKKKGTFIFGNTFPQRTLVIKMQTILEALFDLNVCMSS